MGYILKHLHLQMLPKRTFNAKPLLAVLGCSLGVAIAAHAEDAFNPATNLLTIDQVTVPGLGVYKDVTAKIHSYSLLGVDNGVPQAASFDQVTQLLTLGAVKFEGKTYNNVRVKINLHTLLGAAFSAPVTQTTPTQTTLTAPTVTYYFSDCQLGAAAGCLPGNNANPGTQAAPKRDLAGVLVNALPAGAQLLFARGGVWTNFNAYLDNRNASVAAPLVFANYTPAWAANTTAAPELRSSTIAFNIGGSYGNTIADGGYTIRGFKLNGAGSGDTAFFVSSTTRGILIEDNEVTGFGLGFNVQNIGPEGNQGLVVRNNNIHHNSRMGFLGEAYGMVIEGNTFANNNFSGSGFNHAIYIGGRGTNGIIRNNVLTNNSVVNGVCTGGNMTIHGQWDGFLIEGNTITQEAAVGGCYGVSVTPGYFSAEFFRNFVVRNNTVVNVGGCALCFGAAVGPIVENNLLINRNNSWMSGVVLATNVGTPGIGGDDIDSGAVIRNNTVCFVYPRPESQQVAAANAGQVTISGTVYRTGADATSGPCAR